MVKVKISLNKIYKISDDVVAREIAEEIHHYSHNLRNRGYGRRDIYG